MFTLFLTWTVPGHSPAAPEGADLASLARIVHAARGLSGALAHTAAQADDPYLNDGPAPPLALELTFSEIAALEAACATDGALQALASPGLLPGLSGAAVTEQAMLARPFPVDGPPPPETSCTYLVTYTGRAADPNAWHAYYLAHHPAIMRRFPGIRAIEVCTRIDWIGFLPFTRVDHMQRNKVVFDDPAALHAALNSPVRHEMRADFHHFPPYKGGNTHFPMVTRRLA